MPSLLLSGTSAMHCQSQQEALPTRQFLTFLLGQEMFAMPIEDIREIIGLSHLTQVPLMPSFLRGVINLRGAVVPVIDLSVRVGRAATQLARRTCIVILELQHDQQMLLLGVMVDAVRTVLTVEQGKIVPRSGSDGRLRADFIEGMINLSERWVVVLDVNVVFSVDELVSLIGVISQDENNFAIASHLD